jgi:YegS/Rv2252/BmrU family lipid kinase
MKVLVIYNPAAGGGREKLLQQFLDALDQHGLHTEVYRTRAPGDATVYLRGRDDQGDMVIAVGGDGTTNEVINGLNPGVRLGIFATGTANVLGQELALPKDPHRAAAVIAQGRALPIWPGRLHDKRFVMMVGIGYDAWVVEGVDLALKQKIGKGAYVAAMLANIGRYGSRRYRVRIDGDEHDCYSLIVTNGRCYGGSFVLSQQADISQPRFQVLLFQRPGRWALIRTLLHLPLGRIERAKGVLSLPATQVEVLMQANEPVQADGDLTGFLPASLQVDSEPVPVQVAESVWHRYQ